ncbi:hypothetical protein ETD86_15050 [Nonomuraea turkmeniaca]|uniref:Uncharacterized protein n=1 Tax=Nonomuraea turkmeniaca TaxID=103838 RepID=A0A5S4G674_9ACTN|nr:hypothetical protein [Nonomuraea turkmeniaca]TMR21490.1 hypothetical protein ETD86_15050 [Nonomuraea turkmeniaca]
MLGHDGIASAGRRVGRSAPSAESWGESVRWRLAASTFCALAAAALAAVQVLTAHRFGVNEWTIEGGSYSEYIDWDHAVTRSTWYPAASTLVASAITYRVFQRAPWSWLWLPPAAWLGSSLSAVPLLYGLASAAPEDGINSSPSEVAWATIIGGAIGVAAAMAALRHREVGIGLVAYTLWVSILEFTRPWWWDRPPTFDPMLTEGVLSSETGEYVVQATLIEAGGVTAGLIGPVMVSGTIAAWAAAQRGRWMIGALAGTAGPLLLCSVYLTIDPGLNDQDSLQATLWFNSIVALLIGLCVSTITATLSQTIAKRKQAGARDGSGW